MTQPSHTHRTRGGRFAHIASYNGDTSLDAQMIVVYRDLDMETDTATVVADWEKNWRPIAPDDCTVCMGTGQDAIKGAAGQPCGGCYGMGKVKADGETPADRWELAEIAGGIIRRQQQELEQLRKTMALPKVAAAIKSHRDAQGSDWAHREQKWREGPGHGPGGRRHTGD